jgi:hypothetical protein
VILKSRGRVKDASVHVHYREEGLFGGSTLSIRQTRIDENGLLDWRLLQQSSIYRAGQEARVWAVGKLAP